jgi:hypothetical protein
LRVHRLDHLAPPIEAHRPEVFAKKSRSTTSRPIFACRVSTSASAAFALIRFAVQPCVAVSSPRSTSSALKSAAYRVQLPVMRQHFVPSCNAGGSGGWRRVA